MINYRTVIKYMFLYKNFEFSTFIKGWIHLYETFLFWCDYITDNEDEEILPHFRKEFWWHLSGRYFYWYIDTFSSPEYCNMFHHVHTGVMLPEE